MIATKQVRPMELDEAPATLDSLGVCYYRSAAQLAMFLDGFSRVPHARYLLLLGLRNGMPLPANLPQQVRMIPTTDEDLNPNEEVGNYVPDALRAFQLAAWGLRADESLVVLLPADWKGPKPEGLLAICQAMAPWPLKVSQSPSVMNGRQSRAWATWWQQRKVSPRLLPGARGQDKLEAFHGMVCD